MNENKLLGAAKPASVRDQNKITRERSATSLTIAEDKGPLTFVLRKSLASIILRKKRKEQDNADGSERRRESGAVAAKKLK